MIQYVTLGTSDLQRAGKFFDELFAIWDAQRVMDSDRMIFWMPASGGPGVAVCTPFDGERASVGNGTMVALSAATPEQVDEIYQKAIELGATSEGEPGARGDQSYAAYFRDLDGNKFNAFCLTV